MVEPSMGEQGIVINPQAAPKENTFEAALAESTAAREITKQVKPSVIALADELNSQATNEDGTRSEPLDQKNWYNIRTELKQPVTLAELKKTHPDLVLGLQQPIIEKDELVDGDDLAQQITDNSLVNGITITNNPDADYLGLDIHMSTDSSQKEGQTVRISTFGDEGYTKIERDGKSHEVDGTPGMRYETRQVASKVTKMAQDMHSFMGANIRQGNVAVDAYQQK